ncbi:MAG: N-6 DNA methylase [Acetobacteraceae bacterium]|nr:N-6 DNA methylase [Acetobacteraceae bacterium]
MGSATVEELVSRSASRVAQALQESAGRGGTEADFRREAARVLEETALEAGLVLKPRDEYSVARGRVDSLYNRLVLEYKRPGTLRPSNAGHANKSVIEQVEGYILDVARRERREASRLAGVVTDGFYFIFVRRVGDGWSIDEPVAVNEGSAELFLRLLFSLATGAALVPENLLADFGPRTDNAKRSVRALYRALHRSKHPLVIKLFEQWATFFGEATDYREWASRIEGKEEFQSFVRGMGLEPRYVEAPRVFFALHTYYALLIKLIAFLAAEHFAGGSHLSLQKLGCTEGADLRWAFAALERGDPFRDYGIRNFLEGDFFGWYLPAWDEEVEWAAARLARQLAKYDPGTLELAPENARDLLKKLYHYLLPRDIRHDLGEYYTPDWLAERLIRQTLGEADLGNPRKRVLDPACGSGTFLVALIRHIRDRAGRKKSDARETLMLILQNVVGIDLNPLAVIAARTNYLLALGDLLKARLADRPIDIPVYQADSVLTPQPGTGIFEDNVYPLTTSVGVFRIPACFADRQRLDALANLLDEATEAGVAEDAFLARVSSAGIVEPEEMAVAEGDIRLLYRQLRELHDEGLDGVWARIVKNTFAPLFLEPCHYVVGNPPWVNWENLPDDYRSRTKPLWEYYKLFPHEGMDTILGKGKKDISMLMTYVAAHRYLRQGGKLGFLLSQSLFKASAASQGFRRFCLPDGTPFGPLVVEDMTELDPFERATNRPTVAVFAKGHAVRYPVSYQYWKKRQTGRGSAIGFDTPYAAVSSEKVTYREWFAEPVDAGDPTSAWLTGRRWSIRALRKVLGSSHYTAHEGCNTGGANAVFWVDIVSPRPGGFAIVANITEGARREVPRTQASVEPELLYPLLRGRDVRRWSAVPSGHILMTQDPSTRRGISREVMEARYPKAHSYLSRFEVLLRRRAAFRRYFKDADPYWSMFNVSLFTFAPWKVVWREVANEVEAAVVGRADVLGVAKPVIPDHTCILVDCASEEEAHYLCAVLNSAPSRLAIKNYIVLHPDPHVLKHVSIPRFSPKNTAHVRLAELSQQAHEAAKQTEWQRVARIQGQVDRWAAALWGLTDEESAEIRRSLEDS